MGFYLKKQKVGFTTSWERAEQKIARCWNGRSRELAIPFLLRREGEGGLLKGSLRLPSALHEEYVHKLTTLLIPFPSTKPQRSGRSHHTVGTSTLRTAKQKHLHRLRAVSLGQGTAEPPISHFPASQRASGDTGTGEPSALTQESGLEPRSEPSALCWVTFNTARTLTAFRLPHRLIPLGNCKRCV